MLAYTYEENGKFVLKEKEKPTLQSEDDAIVRVTLASICSSDLHIKHGAVPRAVPGITVGHEMVGIVEETGRRVTKVKPGDRVTVNVETFCGECFFCKNGFVNNCTDQNGGWALGCRIDGGQAEYVRVPYAEQGLNKIPDSVTDEAALFVGDVLATGFWAARISEIGEEDTVVIIGGGPTGICTLLCVMLKNPEKIILCEVDPKRIAFVKEHYPDVLVVNPKETDAERFVKENSRHNGADRVLEVAGSSDTFELAWKALQEILKMHGADGAATGSPREILQLGYKLGFVDDATVWLLMLKKRNTSVHIYNEQEIDEMILLIRDSFIPAFCVLEKTLQRKLEETKEDWKK